MEIYADTLTGPLCFTSAPFNAYMYANDEIGCSPLQNLYNVNMCLSTVPDWSRKDVSLRLKARQQCWQYKCETNSKMKRQQDIGYLYSYTFDSHYVFQYELWADNRLRHGNYVKYYDTSLRIVVRDRKNPGIFSLYNKLQCILKKSIR